MSIKKEIIETEVRASGFKKFQDDIMLTNKKIEEYNDDLKRLRYEKDKLIAAGQKETKAYREITKEISAVRKSLNQSKDALKEQEKQLPLTALSYNQLKKKAGELTKELYNMSEAADPVAFTKARGELKQYQDQMTKMQQGIKITNAAFKNQKPTLWTNLKQLIPIASITAIGAKLTSVSNQAIQTFARLDDKMADVQKTTQMSKAEVKALDVELMKIDTRTSREDLLDLARVAGKLGVAKNEVAGFVRATDQIKVALTEDLGGDVEESIRKIGKLADIFKIKDQLGLEKSLLSIGSAVNSLGAASTANEENIVDFTNRTAGIAPQAKVSIQNVMGLGAAIDKLAITAEVGGTTYSQVMTGMFKKTDEYAKVAGMSVKEFTELLNRDANEAFLKFLEGANSGGDMSGMTKKLAGLKLEGARATQVLGALAKSVDDIRVQQALSNAEFAKATSVQEEANTKNASAQALIEKRQKAIDQIVASLGEKLMPLWSETLGLTAGFMTILKAMVSTLFKYKDIIISTSLAVGVHIVWSKAYALWTTRTTAGTLLHTAALKARIIWEKATVAAMQLHLAMNALFTGSLKTARLAMLAFTKATLLSPAGIVIALTAIIYAVTKLGKSYDAAARSATDMSDVTVKAGNSYMNEKVKLEQLLKIASDKTASDQARKKAIKELQAAIPNGINLINEETIATGKAKRAVDDYCDSLMLQAKLEAAKEKLIEIEKERIKAIEDGERTQVSAWQATKAMFSSGRLFGSMNTPSAPSSDGMAKYMSEISDYAEENKREFDEMYDHRESRMSEYIKALYQELAAQKNTKNILGDDNPSEGKNSIDGNDKKQKGKWSLTSDEAYLKAKAQLRERQMKGDIATEEEYSRQLLALEIKTLEDRIALNKEKDGDLAKLKSELTEKQIQQMKADQARIQKLRDIAAEGDSDTEKENATYEKRLTDAGLFNRKIEDMTEDEQAALLQIERAHWHNLSKLYLDEQAKEAAKLQTQIQRKTTALKQEHNDELAKATTFGQKKALLRKWLSDEELKKVRTDKEADKQLKDHYAADEQADLKKDLTKMISIYEDMAREVDETGLFANGVAATEEDIERLNAIIDDLREQLAKLGVTPPPTLGGDKDRKSNVDILGMSVEDWERFHKNIKDGKFGLDEIVAIANAIGSAFSSVNELVSAMEQREFKNYEKTQKKKKNLLDRQLKSGTISQERYNEAVQRIDDETDAKREEMERKQAKRQKMLSVFQSLINTAVAVSAMLGAQPAGPWNIPLAITVGAMGLVQTAAILATPLPGAEEGGLIGVKREQDGKRFNAEFAPRQRGYVHRPTVIQTGSGQPVLTGEAGTEYVVPNHLLQVPQIASMVGLIEAARLSGTFRPVNLPAAQAASGVIPGRAGGGYVGDNPLSAAMIAGGQVPASTASDDGLLREVKDAISKLSRQLEKPLPVAVSAYGRDGILTIQKKIEQQQLRAGIGGRSK